MSYCEGCAIVIDLNAERDRLAARVAALEQSLGILLRACEAGAYVGRLSDAVLQARALLEPTP